MAATDHQVTRDHAAYHLLWAVTGDSLLFTVFQKSSGLFSSFIVLLGTQWV